MKAGILVVIGIATAQPSPPSKTYVRIPETTVADCEAKKPALIDAERARLPVETRESAVITVDCDPKDPR
jgi:hypothetical protein